MRDILKVLLLSAAIAALTQAPSAADEHKCWWEDLVKVCEGGGSDPGDPGEVNVWTGDKGWAAPQSPATCTLSNGPNAGLEAPSYFRWLVWLQGPRASHPVEATDFGASYGVGDQVPPRAQVRWDGSLPTFEADARAYDRVCVDPGTPGISIREEIARRAPAPEVGRLPGVSGLTGLPQRLWYESPATIAPFSLTFTDPVTGLTFVVEAQAWIAEFRWAFGDGASVTSSFPGSEAEPAAAHTYEAKGIYDLAVEVDWVGEWRIYEVAGVPPPWSPVPDGPTIVDIQTFVVEEIVGRRS